MKMTRKRFSTGAEAAGPARPQSASRGRLLFVYLALSLSAAVLLFGPLGRSGRFSASGASLSTAPLGATAFQAMGGDAVKLGQQLGTFPAGSVIPVVRCVGDFIGTGPDCPFRHLHAASPGGITICNQGPFPDPNPEGCGYGQI